VTNVYRPELDSSTDRDGFRYRAAKIGRQAGSKRLGASVYEIEPGSATFPYHYHFANEELLIVLRGRPHVRTPGGWRELGEGDVIAFPVGEQGGHQIINNGTDLVRILVVSEMVSPDVVVYPDSDKVGARENAPGSPPGGLRLNFHANDAVDYWEGESPPGSRGEASR
jgi:uncharacterized cupin superfamily protein